MFKKRLPKVSFLQIPMLLDQTPAALNANIYNKGAKTLPHCH